MVTNRLLRSGQRPIWHLVDAKGQVVGRLATQIAALLSGKHKPVRRRNDLCGDVVVVVNASEVVFTGKKETDKTYKWHTGYPGGRRERTVAQQRERNSEEILRRAVHGMLPKNKLRKNMIGQLLLYPGPSHPQKLQLTGKQDLLTAEEAVNTESQ